MKKLIALALIIIAGIFFLISYGNSQTKSYYSGDAANFKGQLYVTTANTDSLEVFKLEKTELVELAKVRPVDPRFSTPGKFYDSLLFPQDGRLYVYAISDFSLYKYEIVDDKLVFVASQKNTYWEWYNRVDKFGDRVVTVSAKGIKIWGDNLDVIGGYNFTNSETPYNVRAYNDNYILNVQNNQLTAYRPETDSTAVTIPVNYKSNPGNRAAYQDADGNLYIVDDFYAKKFNLDGQLLASFKHLDFAGYDVASAGNDFIYFSNGVGVVKLDKANMKLAGFRFTGGLGGARGWAMGLKVVEAGGDKVVIFNNANILVLDDKLAKLASFASTEKEDEASSENLFLRLDRTSGPAGTSVRLNGGGYFPNEDLMIDFGGSKSTSVADMRGRFEKELIIPSTATGTKDIKVTGNSSRLTYSISFRIQ